MNMVYSDKIYDKVLMKQTKKSVLTVLQVRN